jgi:hypothetical protein
MGVSVYLPENIFVDFCFIFVKNAAFMNALRTFATPTADGTLTIHLPEEYRHQSLEIIVLPLSDFPLPTQQTTSKSLEKTKLSDKYRGVFTKADAQSFDQHTQQMRQEWNNI